MGQGGSGVVHAIQEKKSGKLRALKIQKEESTDALSIANEKKILGDLRNFESVAHLAREKSSGNLEPFMIMDFLEGVAISELKGETARRENRKETFQLLNKIAQIYAKLVEEYGVLHRDVKPGNLIFDRFGNVYVIDFGIAIKEATIGKLETSSGTVKYMPRERLMVQEHRRSDIYSLAVMFFELVEGVHPLAAQTEETVADAEPLLNSVVEFHMKGEFQKTIERSASMPDKFKELLIKMAEKNVQQRPEYQEVEERMRSIALEID
jgi:serine/threonine-protein kinase